MPELPEVETIKNQIEEFVPFTVKKIFKSEHAGKILIIKDFSPVNREVVKISRHGKVLDFVLKNGEHIVSRLGMSGGWRKYDTSPKEKHAHITLKIQSGKKIVFLAYVDPRRFGKIYFFSSDSALLYFKKLGVDVSSNLFTPEYLLNICKKHGKRSIKVLLLEQKYFAGIGNYIASEICALSKILPTRKAVSISLSDAKKMCEATKKIISRNIKSQGMSFKGGYFDVSGSKGDALNNLVVFYQETCGMCKKTKVEKIILGGRGTYYCPRCQK